MNMVRNGVNLERQASRSSVQSDKDDSAKSDSALAHMKCAPVMARQRLLGEYRLFAEQHIVSAPSTNAEKSVYHTALLSYMLREVSIVGSCVEVPAKFTLMEDGGIKLRMSQKWAKSTELFISAVDQQSSGRSIFVGRVQLFQTLSSECTLASEKVLTQNSVFFETWPFFKELELPKWYESYDGGGVNGVKGNAVVKDAVEGRMKRFSSHARDNQHLLCGTCKERNRLTQRQETNSGLDRNSMVGEMVVEAGKNVTLNCPGVTENSLILMLEWRVNSMQLLEYSSNTTIVWNHQNRVSLSLKNYALQFHPVTAQDTGEYTCLVNSRSMAEAVISLIVHGALERVVGKSTTTNQLHTRGNGPSADSASPTVIALKPGKKRRVGVRYGTAARNCNKSPGRRLAAIEFRCLRFYNKESNALTFSPTLKTSLKAINFESPPKNERMKEHLRESAHFILNLLELVMSFIQFPK
ncbi:hypothetical protein WN51_13659 [Melipona quadrifasciata]|uniref:Ig-like domain-containing protein n=2 Tax=Meliponini TaxID=83319 RepID=A0A0N0U4V9_9HYME|nr:hypothetical protein WN51_13659 [Melipona quadrifasciata]